MASVAESVCSVPVEDLLKARDHLRGDLTEIDDQLPQQPTSPEAIADQSIAESVFIPKSPELSAKTTKVSATTHVPRLAASKSALPAEMEPMIQPTTLQDAYHHFSRAQNLGAFGDTQELPSQVLLTASICLREQVNQTPSKRGANTDLDAYPDTEDTGRDHEDGQVDLAAHWQGSSQADEEFLRDDTQPEPQILPDTQYHAHEVPATPAPTGQHWAHVPTSVANTKTPGYSQFFAGEKPEVLSNTQLFQQTQMQSSPLADGLRSDPVNTRPSPDSNNQPLPSSPFLTISSPSEVRNTRLPSSAREPRAHYRSMKESQEERDLRVQVLKDKGGQFSDSADELMDEEDTQGRRIRAKRLRRHHSEDDVLTKIRAPARPSSRPSSARRGKSPIPLDTPATLQRRYNELLENIEVDDDDAVEEDQELPIELDHRVQYSEREEPDGSALDQDEARDVENDENDQYDEYTQSIVRSQLDSVEKEDGDASTTGGDPEDEDLVQPEHEVKSEGLHSEANGQRVTRPSTQLSTTIADSQPTSQNTRNNDLSEQRLHSVKLSYVPGSQYTGQTSEDLAVLKSPPSSRQVRVAASQPTEVGRSVEEGIDGRVAASLPEQTGSSAGEHVPDAALKQEIPERDRGEAEAALPHSANGMQTNESGSLTLFSTARSHMSTTVQSPAKPTDTQQSRLTEPSPRKAAGARHFSDIAAAPPTAVTGSFYTQASEEVDYDGIMDGVISAEDKKFMQQFSSPEPPRRKRIKLGHASSSLSEEPEQRLPQETAVVADKRKSRRLNARRTTQGADDGSTRSELPYGVDAVQEDAGSEDEDAQGGSHMASDAPGTIADSEPDFTRPDSPFTVLKERPSKANELLLSTPLRDVVDEEMLDWASDSILKREAAGRATVSQPVATRSNALARKPVTYGRASRRKLGNEKTKASGKLTSVRPPTPDESAAEDKAEEGLIEGDGEDAGITDTTTVPTEASTPAVRHAITDSNHANAHEPPSPVREEPLDDALVTAPERVFALFKGTPPHFFAATFLGRSADGSTFRIRFDDNTVTDIEPHHVRRLELKDGDVVKVDDPLMRKKNWRIVGFGRVARNQTERDIGTDMAGHMYAKVETSGLRNSTSNMTSTRQVADEVHEVMINTLYLTNSLWSQMNGRPFEPSNKVKTGRPEAGTPASSRSHTPVSDNPASRSRRAVGPTAGSRPSLLRENSVALSINGTTSSAIFDGMAFAISYVSADEEKAEVTRHIQRNGGMVLKEGFEELFDLPSINSSGLVSPTEAHDRQYGFDMSATDLQLKAEYQGLHFAALIADCHSRRAKYMQALALDLPILSGRWILHSLDTTKNASLNTGDITPAPWSRYLLPAGESSYLAGAIRSRTLMPYEPSTAQLATIIADRPNLLNSEGLLIVAPKKGKANWEKRKTYVFLTLALGAGQVKRVLDLQEAKKLTLEDPDTWKWVYADCSIEEAKTVLFGKFAGGKKRKRGVEAGVVTGDAKMSATDGKVKIVNDEFVIQSLILGALVE